MNQHRLFRCISTWLLVCIIALSFSIPAAEAVGNSGVNRFNVVVVLDASGSMRRVDPEGYRYRAITQFTNLLAERGNVLGSIVFHTGIAGEQNMVPVQKQAEKDAAVSLLESIPADGGWTNIGAGLSQAVSMIESCGDPSLPSVILLLSDGNTEMSTDEETQDSLDMKAEALQAAREKGISIYSVCLNADQTADISEMQQISDATGGVFQEVTAAEDLQETFNTFYELIYGTSTIPLFSDVIPASGRLETAFDIPGIGVEEVNIIIYGDVSALRLLRPDGSESAASQMSFDGFSMLKLTDILPGTWTLVTEGVPGDDIRINMVYNTDLGIEVSAEPSDPMITPDDMVTITARLTGNAGAADSSQQYIGYSAELLVMDAYGDYVESTPMQVAGDHFEAVRSFDEGVYYYKVAVTGNHMEKESAGVGPLTSAAGAAVEQVNTAPVPVDDVVKATVNIWPFKGGSYTLDLNTLDTDAEDSALNYKILSSSFIEGTDYTVDADGVLRMDHFSLSKGAFTVRATDSGGLSCEIEVIVHAINIGIVTLIVLGILALVAAAIFGVLLYIALNKPFRGTISAQSYCNGVFRGTPRTPRRGRCKLAAFGMDSVGLDYQKSYFQATGQNYVELCTNVPVIWNGQETRKVRITSGAEVTITIRRDDPRKLYVRFDSRMRGGGRRGGRGPVRRH